MKVGELDRGPPKYIEKEKRWGRVKNWREKDSVRKIKREKKRNE